jgi:membrane fusion protein (multidrug efflux system)
MTLKLLIGMVGLSLATSNVLYAAAENNGVAKPATPVIQPASPISNIPATATILDSKTPEYVILQPSDEATFSSETTASIAKLFVKEGSYFKVGDILIELDCRVQKAEFDKAVAQQSASNIALKSAKKLKSYDAISEFELVKAQSEAAMVNADVSKLNAIMEKCIIKAPFNGAVSELRVHTYESVKPGDPLIKIVNIENPIVEMQVPSSWLQWLHVGSTFDVHVNEINKSIPAKIIRINPEIEPVSQTVKIVGELSTTTDKLLPGMSGQANFPDNPYKLTAAGK